VLDLCKYHHRRDYPQNQGGRPQIYSSQEAQKIGDVGHIIPLIYVALDNSKSNNKAHIINMEGKLCDQVVSILIDRGSNYIYISLDMVHKCCLNK